MTKPWDEYREIIIAEYKDQNKPLHVVQRTMEEKYGFKASTRAYRSRFDKWGIHKYTHRQHGHLDGGDDCEDSIADGTAGLSLHGTSGDSSRDTSSPIMAPPQMYSPNTARSPLAGYGNPNGFRTDSHLQYQYTQPMHSMPQPNTRYAPHQFGAPYDQYYSQDVSYYPPNSMPLYQERADGLMVPTTPFSSDQAMGCKQEHQWDTTSSRTRH
ncbi:Clr5 domain-containing protein [Cladorrhinum sp. PSN332]|nr:Clr5 domain-containing protein [Cladorrhinum sp. PSN332]